MGWSKSERKIRSLLVGKMRVYRKVSFEGK